MAIFKCKMCGGALEVSENQSVATCEYCGTQQTLPKVDDEKKLALFNRANNLRLKSEFDKAAGIYESIIAEFPEEAEAFWGLVLCKYGIEYVDDKDGSKIPTCHRTLPTSIMKDEDFQQACENADISAKTLYREEAKAIDGIQKKILEIAATEEPYDIFICYKETDDITGSRTEDSSIAQDIYIALTEMGYKVFYARNSLRKVAGTEYEPYIYAALSSAKVMLAIGTKYDYYDAVWVKNEWSRFISMMGNKTEKILIPCFKNMDAYDIPEEFSYMQALDMADMMFFNSLEASLKRLLPLGIKVTITEAPVVNSGAGATIDSLLKRAFIFLEDEGWESADEYCEKVLDIDPENVQAYLGKLMAEFEVCSVEDLMDVEYPFDDNFNYQKIMCFGDEALKTELAGYVEYIKERNEKERVEEIYSEAKEEMVSAETEEGFKRIADDFDSISDYKDSAELRDKCLELAEAYEIEKKEIAAKKKAEKDKKEKLQNLLSAAFFHGVGVKSDGTVFAAGDNKKGQCNIQNWSGIVAVSAGDCHTVGLKFDGTVLAVGDNKNGQCNIQNWSGMIAISAGDCHTVGLKSDGTVVATEFVKTKTYRPYSGQCDVSDWTDIVAVSAGKYHSIGLKSDGTVVATSIREVGDCGQSSVSKWSRIVAVSASEYHTVGLKSNGTVVAVGSNALGQCDVLGWTDIVAVSAGRHHTVGLKSDGTVVATTFIKGKLIEYSGECEVSCWKDIVAISAGDGYTLGLKSDGTVISTKFLSRNLSYKIQNEVGAWRLFDSLENLEDEQKTKMAEAKLLKEQQFKYRSQGLCQYCGGELKGFIGKKCVKCGKPKDY